MKTKRVVIDCEGDMDVLSAVKNVYYALQQQADDHPAWRIKQTEEVIENREGEVLVFTVSHKTAKILKK